MNLKVLCYLLCAIALHILPAPCQGDGNTTSTAPPLIIRLSHAINETYMILPTGINRATIEVLTQGVTLETNNDTGIWQRPNNTNTTESKIDFPIFTADFAGLYKYYLPNQNGSRYLGIQINISVSGTKFAELISTGDYMMLNGNNIFYTNTTLVCATNDTSQQIQWTHQPNLDSEASDVTGLSTTDFATGISTLDIRTSTQGYYTCIPIPGETNYMVGIFDRDTTIVAKEGESYTFTKGIDPSAIQLLCVAGNNIPLMDISWDSSAPPNQNPISINSLTNMEYTLTCNRGTSAILSITLLVQGPPTITLSNTTQNMFSMLPPGDNTADIRVLTDNVILRTELTGRWERPNYPSTSDKSIHFPYFTVNYAGQYSFYVTGWNNTEVLAIQIIISATGSSFAEETSPGAYEVLSGNNIFYTGKMLVCATSDTSQEIEWTYRVTQDSSPINEAAFANWNSTSGISKLELKTTKPGYYTCVIQTGGTSYSSALFTQNITIVATDGMSIVYTKSIDPVDIQLLCTTTDSSIPLDDIRWNVSTPNNNNENPVILRSLFNANYILNCNGGTSSLSFNVNLLIQGPPAITLSGTEYTSLANTADIRVLTQNVSIQANLIGMWYKPGGLYTSENPITYSIFTANQRGLYIFYVNSWKGIQVIANFVNIFATGSNFAERLPSGDYELLTGDNIFYASKTLVCVTSDTSQEIQWTYQSTQDGAEVSKTTDASYSSVTGISELSITTTEQGYYTCEIVSGDTSYTTAIFNPDITIVATSAFHSYIKGIDPTNIQLLCDPNDTTVDLNTIKLEYSGKQFNNPLILNEAGSISGIIQCSCGSSIQLQFLLVILEPTLTLTYAVYSMQYSTLSPSNVPITIPLFTNDVKLTIGSIITGEWNLPRTSIGGIRISIPTFTLTSTGRYTYNSTQTWDGMEREIFRLDISSTGDPFAIMESVGEYTPQSNNPIFYTDTTLVCLTDYDTQVMWYYRERTLSVTQAITTPNTDTYGISTYIATLTKPGFYSCEGSNYASAYTYTAGVFNGVNTRVAVEGGSYSYTIGIDSEKAELLCDLDDGSVNLNSVAWVREDNFANPLDISENIDDLALGTIEIKCYPSATTDVRLTADLTIQDIPVIHVDYLEETTSFTLSQSEPIHIPLLTNNTVVSSNLINGMWRFKYTNGSTEYGDNREYRVDLFTANNIGVYQYVFSNFYDGEEIIQVTLNGTGSGLGMQSDDEITTVKNNTIFHQDSLILVAASNKQQLEANDIVWTRQDAIADTFFVNISEATIDSTLSISRLNLDTLSDGYYTVAVKDINSMTEQYIVGVFNKSENTYDTRIVDTISYTPGVDSVDLQILCIPQGNPGLTSIRWTNGSGVYFPNPANLSEIERVLSTVDVVALLCVDIAFPSDTLEEIQLFLPGEPNIILSYFGSRIQVTGKTENIRNISVFTADVQFKCNKENCRWSSSNSSDGSITVGYNQTYTIPYITIDNNKLYTLLTLDNNQMFIDSVTTEIRAVGTAFQKLIRNGSEEVYQTVTTNSIINLEENVTLVCATSYVSVAEGDIRWFFQETDSPEEEPMNGNFNMAMGLSLLVVDKAGFYTCQVPDESQKLFNHSVGVYSISNETMEISLDDLLSSKEVNFVRGEELQLYYQNETIRIQAIRWGVQRTQANELSFFEEYSNPVDVNTVFNEYGSGAFRFSCFYRQSPITIIGDASLNLKDTTLLTVQYDGAMVMMGFSDENNPMFPEPQMISIPIVTKDVSISCSLPACNGQIVKDGEAISQFMIPSVTIENAGIYAIKRETEAGVVYTTALMNLAVTGFMAQSIASLNVSIINDTSVFVFWKLLNQLPDNAMETFNISYVGMGNRIHARNNTKNLDLTLTDLTPDIVYTILVELSYAYTINSSSISVEVTIPLVEPPPPILLVPILIILIIIVVIVIVIVVLIVICIVIMHRRKQRKFQTLENDEANKSKPILNRLSHGYAQLETPLDNPMYSPDLTDSLMEKPKFIESVHNQNENYQNLIEIQNPRMKPIPLDLFKQTVDKLWENDNTLEEEYKSLGGDVLRYESKHAQIDQNRIKNKYKFIYPYDKSRVVLEKLGKDPNSDYINASNIPGLYVTQKFIAAQGPKENTIQDLWRMVLEKNIRNIVMVTNCVEGGKLKCEEYFPLKEDKTMKLGKYTVRNTSTNQFKGHTTRTLKLTFDEHSTQIKHFHFTAWPDHDVPSLFDELLAFVGFVQNNITVSDAPILVHCSAGVGRTGTFITLFNLRYAIQKGQPISIYLLAHEMREHRPHMVQTFRQYKFIYLAVLELLLDKTSIPVQEFNNTYSKYLESDQEGYVSVFFQQFAELNYQCEKSFILSCSEGKNNEGKNPNNTILPFDNNRVVISSPHFPSNYINASYHENNLFITAQNPIAKTVRDFLQMIYQKEATLVIMLSTPKEKSKILGNLSDRKPYWPNKEGTLDVSPFQVEVVSSEKSSAMIKQRITLRNLQENSERSFMQIISTTWEENNDPNDLQSVVILIHSILKHRQDNPNTTMIMHCSDSISKTGVVFTVYQCIRDMQETGEVDIFHTIKRLRREKLNIIPDLSNFLSCYALMNEYCSST